MRPGSRRGLARLLGSGQVDLLHFAGHGRSDDAVIPPVREMLLSTYRQPVGEAARRRGGTFTLDDLRAALPERERQILLLRFFGGLTQTEIGAQVGISQMHVSRLLTRTLTRLRHQLAAD